MSSKYAEAGVDIRAGERAVDLIRAHARSTFGPNVLGDLGAFSGLYALQGYRSPVLVSSADGVGTKLKIAFAMDVHNTVGRDLVAHCVNDILTAGAEPLFFLDYVATGKLDPVKVASIVEGIAAECRQVGCALVGGETAEMPDIYAPGEYDLAGFIVGIVERDGIVDGSGVQEGDRVWGFPSSGLHTNGYSLVRRVFQGRSLREFVPALGRTLGEELLEPHRCYLPLMRPLLQAGLVRSMAHITGGGLVGNIPRSLPDGLGVELRWGTWPLLPIFHLVQQEGQVSLEEMVQVFNMGLGWVFVASPEKDDEVRRLAPEALLVGRVIATDRQRVVFAGEP